MRGAWNGAWRGVGEGLGEGNVFWRVSACLVAAFDVMNTVIYLWCFYLTFQTTKSPVTWMTIQPPTPTANASHHNHTTPAVTTRQPITNSSQANDSTSKDVVVLFTMAPAQVVAWTPAVVECTHIFSAYVVPNFFHFLAFIMGFYHFRIQESEGLHALIEKVR